MSVDAKIRLLILAEAARAVGDLEVCEQIKDMINE